MKINLTSMRILDIFVVVILFFLVILLFGIVVSLYTYEKWIEASGFY